MANVKQLTYNGIKVISPAIITAKICPDCGSHGVTIKQFLVSADKTAVDPDYDIWQCDIKCNDCDAQESYVVHD